jgi:hypothetical protein
MTGTAPTAIPVLLATFLLLSVGCGGETAQENPTPTGTEDGLLSKESAIDLVLGIVTGNPENRVDRSTAKADRMTEGEAEETMRLRGGLQGRSARTPTDRLVWLVEVRGEFVGFRAYGLTPGPVAQTGTLLVIVTMDGLVESGTTLFDTRD